MKRCKKTIFLHPPLHLGAKIKNGCETLGGCVASIWPTLNTPMHGNIRNEKHFFFITYESRASPLSSLKYDSLKLLDLDIWCVYNYIHIINPIWPPMKLFGLEIHWFIYIILSPYFCSYCVHCTLYTAHWCTLYTVHCNLLMELQKCT